MARNGRPRNGVTKTCPECGNSFYLPLCMSSRIACSLKCRDAIKRKARYDDANRLKKCASCQEWKPFEMYAENNGEKAGADSLQAYCVDCSTKKSKEWTSANPRARKEINRRSSQKNKDKYNETLRNMTAEKRERKNELRREWGKRNRHKTRIWNTLRVHRQRAAGDMPDQWAIGRMFCMQDGKCRYCHSLLQKYHIDHMIPVSRGGANDEDNLQLLCPTCNMRKGALTHEEYLDRLAQK